MIFIYLCIKNVDNNHDQEIDWFRAAAARLMEHGYINGEGPCVSSTVRDNDISVPNGKRASHSEQQRRIARQSSSGFQSVAMATAGKGYEVGEDFGEKLQDPAD